MRCPRCGAAAREIATGGFECTSRNTVIAPPEVTGSLPQRFTYVNCGHVFWGWETTDSVERLKERYERVAAPLEARGAAATQSFLAATAATGRRRDSYPTGHEPRVQPRGWWRKPLITEMATTADVYWLLRSSDRYFDPDYHALFVVPTGHVVFESWPLRWVAPSIPGRDVPEWLSKRSPSVPYDRNVTWMESGQLPFLVTGGVPHRPHTVSFRCLDEPALREHGFLGWQIRLEETVAWWEERAGTTA